MRFIYEYFYLTKKLIHIIPVSAKLNWHIWSDSGNIDGNKNEFS